MAGFEKMGARDEDGSFRVVVEAPRGSTTKLKWDEDLGAFTIARPLILGVRYPFDWGFVPGTLAADGDPLDAMVLHDAATYPGVVIPCTPLGVIKVGERKKRKHEPKRNDRVIAVPVDAPRYDDLRDARDLPKRTRDELQEFFLTVVRLGDKEVEILGWDGPKAANKLIDQMAKAAKRQDEEALPRSAKAASKPRAKRRTGKR
jgi:inorganic pyrophosphatase